MLASQLMSRTSRCYLLMLNSPNCGNTPFGKKLKLSAEISSHGIPIVWPAIRWTADRLFISSTQGNLRALNFQLVGVITLVKVNLCSIWLSGKANTMLILFPKIRNADFAKKNAWEYSPAKRQWGISMIHEQRQSWWKRKNLVLCAWLLRNM